jgi:hypothetical protein
MCSPNNIDLCDDAKKAEIAKFQAMDSAELDKLIAAEEVKLEEAESEFKAEVQKLQDRYTALSTEKDEKIAAVKAAGLGKFPALLVLEGAAGSDIQTSFKCKILTESLTYFLSFKSGLMKAVKASKPSGNDEL